MAQVIRHLPTVPRFDYVGYDVRILWSDEDGVLDDFYLRMWVETRELERIARQWLEEQLHAYVNQQLLAAYERTVTWV